MNPGPLTATIAAALSVAAGAAIAQNYDTRQTTQTYTPSGACQQQYDRNGQPAGCWNRDQNSQYQNGYNNGQYQTGQAQTGQYQTDQSQTGQYQNGQYQNGQYQNAQSQTGQTRTGDAQREYDTARQTYNNSVDAYQQQQQDYLNKDSQYRAQQQAYQDQHARYQVERDRWEAARAAYDARWGDGAYVRRYGPYREVDVYTTTTTTPYRGYAVAQGDPYAPYRDTPCEQRKHTNATTGTVIGALAGAALGSNIASGGGRTGGAIIGALAGGAVGNNIGRSTAHCDASAGYYYYSYQDTTPWAADPEFTGSHSSGWYRRHSCRLASAPVETPSGTEWRYVPVCPDGRGRYRFAQ